MGRVKRDPIDLDEPVPEEETSPVEPVLSTPAPVDNLGYMGPVLPGFLRVTDDREVVKECARHAREEDVDAKGLIHIYVDSCKNLSDPGDPSYNASPMIELFNGKETRKTFTKYYTNDPVIEQGFVLLSRNPYTDEIIVKVIDKNKKEGSKKRGDWNNIHQCLVFDRTAQHGIP